MKSFQSVEIRYSSRFLGKNLGAEGNKVTLPKGVVMLISPVLVMRDFRCYERPDAFYPNHFDADNVAQRSTYSYIPFSAGPRNCIGRIGFIKLYENKKITHNYFIVRFFQTQKILC